MITTLVFIIGIFVSIAFFIITYTLYSKKLGIGYWPLFSFSTASFTIAMFSKEILKNDFAFNYFFLVAMLLLGFAALLKFWDIMRLVE